MLPSTLAMSTATQNTAPTASHFIPGQHFLETFTLLSPNDHDQAFIGNYIIPVLNWQTRPQLYNNFISFLRDFAKNWLKDSVWNSMNKLSKIKIGLVFWHINHCRLFNAKSFLCIYIKYIHSKYIEFVDNIFKQARAFFFFFFFFLKWFHLFLSNTNSFIYY